MSARYDLLVWLFTHGRPGVFRERLVALAARRHVGATGEVFGIDASPAMIHRAVSKAARSGLDVSFKNAVPRCCRFRTPGSMSS
jgi:hypothetical protein